MLWSNEDIAKLREMLVKHPSRSVIEITRMMGRGYNVDDVSGVCGAILMGGCDDMSESKIDPVEFWRLVDEKKPLKEIAKHFGVGINSVHKRITKGRPKSAAVVAEKQDKKENNDMKWTPEQVAQLLNMKAEGFSNTEIAEAIGCPAQTVHNKVCDLKKLNGGVLPTSHKRKYTVADVTPYKPEDVDDLEETPADEPTETPPERPCKVDFDVILDSVDDGKTKTVETVTDAVETVTDNSEAPTAREPKLMDIVDLAYKAKWMANDLGFTLDHFVADVRDVRNEIIVSGKDEDGKVYEIQLSVTDPSKFPR